MNYIHLGKSGCKLEIRDNLIIRKISTQLDYNSRLVLQASKQADFPQSKYKSLRAPKVFKLEDGPQCYFDMEYIPGSSFIDFFETSSFQAIEYATNTLINFLKKNFKNSKNKCINEILLDKLDLLATTTQFSETILRLEAVIKKNDLVIPDSYCHGDMTLSNMLFVNSDIYLIDFLDSFVDSVLIDLIKLKQDLQYFWSLDMVIVRKTRYISIFDYMWTKIANEFSSQVNSKAFKILEIINFLRIEPYISNTGELELLSYIIDRLGEYE
jgi:serine/threonine protein kinase